MSFFLAKLQHMMSLVTCFSFSASLIQHLSYFCFLFQNYVGKYIRVQMQMLQVGMIANRNKSNEI